VLLEVRADRLRKVAYTVQLVGDWRKTRDGRAIEWISPTGKVMPEGDLVELEGFVIPDDFCDAGGLVVHADDLNPVAPAGSGNLAVTVGHDGYLCVEGCIDWVRLLRDGQIIGQRALRDGEPNVWQMDPGPVEIIVFEAHCNIDGSCTYQRAGEACYSPVAMPGGGDHRISITLSASEGAEAVPPCEVALDA